MTSDHFKHLETPCGCLMEDEASRESDETVAEVRRMDGTRAKRAWRCPDLKEFSAPGPDDEFPQAPPSDDPNAIDDHRRAIEAVRQVRTMTGVKCATCPWWYTARPWVIQATEAAIPVNEGGALLVEAETPAPLMQAIRLVRSSRGAEWSYSEKKRKEQ